MTCVTLYYILLYKSKIKKIEIKTKMKINENRNENHTKSIVYKFDINSNRDVTTLSLSSGCN